MSDVADMLLSIPGAAWVWHGLADWRTLPVGEMLWQAIERILQIAGLFEFYRLIDQRLFRSRSKLEMELEASESRVHERNDTISALRGEKKALEADLADARERLPAAAIARADREVRDLNHEGATRHLEQWFTENAESIAAIAKRLAKYHIPRVVPVPGDHLRRARDMLRLAEGALPLDVEVREISRELDRVNADLQAQILRDDDAQIAWNAAMAGGPGAQGDALIPLIITLRDMARWFFDRGLWRLAPLFADRAAELARDAGRQHRRMWYGLEGQAAFYQDALGHSAEALRRIDDVLSQGREILSARDQEFLLARFYRASVLSHLGRDGDALAEIDAFAPIRAEILGARHPNTLATRYLRADVLSRLGRDGDALAEIDAFAPIETEVLGAPHPDTLTTRKLRADVLSRLGRYGDALAEIDASAPIQAEVLGARHPYTLSTRYLRAVVLSGLGRHGDALAELDAFAPIQAEVLGARHPYTLSTRYLRAVVLSGLGRHGDALAEIDAFAPIQAEVQGARHPDTLTTRHVRADALSRLGRHGDALAEIDAFAPIQAEVLGAQHPDTVRTHTLRAEILDRLG